MGGQMTSLFCGGRDVCKQAPIDTDTALFFDYAGNGPWHACAPDAIVCPRLAKSGTASEVDTPATTLAKLLDKAATLKGDKPVFKIELVDGKCPELVDGKAPPALPEEAWTTWTYKQWRDEARNVAKACIEVGFAQFGTMNIWGFNGPQWHILAIAASYAGGKVGGLYPTDTPDTAAYKVVHSGGAIVAVEDRGKLDKLVKSLNERGDAKRIMAFVCWGFTPASGETVSVNGCGAVPLFGWRDFLAKGEAANDASLEGPMAATKPGHCAALIYTSGTTGDPKAVMISHDNIIFEAACVCSLLSKSVGVNMAAEQERILSYLPQSHVAGMMVDIITPLAGGVLYPAWTTVYFARPYDLKVGAIKDRLNAAKPTVFLGVPLVWEKIADKLRSIGAETTGMKKSIATWAKGLGLEHSKAIQLGGTGEYPTGYSLANGLVLSNIKAALGLESCKFGFTGAAPIRADTLEYFGSLGLSINEVYGMSECTGACTWSLDEAHVWGSCGFEMPGVQVRCFKIDEKSGAKTECPRAAEMDTQDDSFHGELCFRGRNIMMGYLANPDLGAAHVADIQKKNAETIDEEGWLHSGDKGLITTCGMVKITGRYKELIIGEGGENIAPVPIEDHVKKSCDGVNEVMMVGDKRKYNVALVTLKAVGANGETPGTDDLDAGAKRVNPEVKTISAAMDDKAWIDAVQAAIESANNSSKVCPNNAFKIQKFCILPTNFSEEKGELTPTKKLKRKVVETTYSSLLDKMYASKETYVRYQP